MNKCLCGVLITTLPSRDVSVVEMVSSAGQKVIVHRKCVPINLSRYLGGCFSCGHKLSPGEMRADCVIPHTGEHRVYHYACAMRDSGLKSALLRS